MLVLGRVVMVIVIVLNHSHMAVVFVVMIAVLLGRSAGCRGRQRQLLERLGHVRVSFLNGAYDRPLKHPGMKRHRHSLDTGNRRVSNPDQIERVAWPALVCHGQSASHAVAQRILTGIYVYGDVAVKVLRLQLVLEILSVDSAAPTTDLIRVWPRACRSGLDLAIE